MTMCVRIYYYSTNSKCGKPVFFSFSPLQIAIGNETDALLRCSAVKQFSKVESKQVVPTWMKQNSTNKIIWGTSERKYWWKSLHFHFRIPQNAIIYWHATSARDRMIGRCEVKHTAHMKYESSLPQWFTLRPAGCMAASPLNVRRSKSE